MEIQHIDNQQSVMCFLTCLFENGVAASAIAGYMAAIKHKFIVYGLNATVCDTQLLVLLKKSFTINGCLKIRQRGIIDIELLKQIVIACDKLQYPLMFRSIFLLAFYTFLHISNFAPITSIQFDVTRQLTRDDVVWGHPGAHIIVK